MSNHAWYAARFLLGTEHAAALRVDHQAPGARGFCPLEHRRWVYRGNHQERRVPVLAGYVFVEMRQPDPARWHEVADNKGFYGFIGGQEPAPDRSGIVEALFARSTEEWILEQKIDQPQLSRFHRGDKVRVAGGVLENCSGRIEWVRHRVEGALAMVAISNFFGEEIRAEMPVEYLELLQKEKLGASKTLLDLPIIRSLNNFGLRGEVFTL